MTRIASLIKIMSSEYVTLADLIEKSLSKFQVYDILSYKKEEGGEPIDISLIPILKLTLLFN